MNETIQRLFDWCDENRIRIKQSKKEYQFFVKNFGKFLLILPKKGKLIGSSVELRFDEKDWQRFEDYEPDYFLYEFGGRWYYSKPIETTDDLEGTCYKATFDDLKYIGKPRISIDLPFVNLGVHSEFEMLNGSGKPNEWVGKAKFLGQKAIGICDKNTLAGTLPLQLECSKKQVKCILGETVSISIDYDAEKEHQITYDVKLYVINKQGWRNLLRISNTLNIDYKGEHVPKEFLFEHSEGLVLVFPKECELNYVLDDPKAFKKTLVEYKRHFKHIYYQVDPVEYHNDTDDIKNLKNIKAYLRNYKKLIKPVLIFDSYYVDKEAYSLKEHLNKIRGMATKYSEDEYFKTLDDIHESFGKLFKDEDEWLELFLEITSNTVEIADICNYNIEVGKPKLPKYEFCPDGMSSDDYFYELIERGVRKKLMKRDKIKGDKLDEYLKRIAIECEVIVPAMMSDYFLILWDIIDWAKKQGIIVGVARGSVGGSMIAYVLDIIDIDPIKYDLLFERFLNETRVTPLEFVELEMEDGKTVKLMKGTKLKMKSGKEVLVEELSEGDDIDIDSVKID